MKLKRRSPQARHAYLEGYLAGIEESVRRLVMVRHALEALADRAGALKKMESALEADAQEGES